MKDGKIVIIHKQAAWGIYYSEDNLLIEYLNSKFNLQVLSWKDIDPKSMEGCIVFLRHPDGYLKTKEKFKDWYLSVESYSKKIINPSSSVLYGLNKKYLLDLKRNGVEIVPSLLINSSNISTIKIPKEKTVIKPTYGESGTGVELLDNPINIEAMKDYVDKYGDCLMQQFFPEVISTGEISTYFINNKYIYSTISKTPDSKQFKVDWELVDQYYPEEQLIRLANDAYSKWYHPVNYARLDWLKSGESYFLSEFEVIDPMFNLKCLDNKTRKCLFYEIERMLK